MEQSIKVLVVEDDNDINQLLCCIIKWSGYLPQPGKGTGLGLSIAKSLMSKMNGKLTAELHGNQLFMKCEWKV